MRGTLTVGSLDVRVKGNETLAIGSCPQPGRVPERSFLSSCRPKYSLLLGRRQHPLPSPFWVEADLISVPDLIRVRLRCAQNARRSMLGIHCTDPFEHLLGRLSFFQAAARRSDKSDAFLNVTSSVLDMLNARLLQLTPHFAF